LGAVAQRLLRAICEHCKEPCEPNRSLLKALSTRCVVADEATFYHGRGCRKCLGSGYSGRLPIFEIAVVTPGIVEAIERGASSSQLREVALEEGMIDLSTAGLDQVLAGKTTVEEAFYKLSV